MAKEVANTFTSAELLNYGNVVYNGYNTTGPNTANKKAWQYKETLTAPVNLPVVTSSTPALKGWTTNSMQYYTNLTNTYGVYPGAPTMFDYVVHSFVASKAAVPGTISATNTLVAGTGYVPGTYTIPLTGGAGTGAYGRVTVEAGGSVTTTLITTPSGGYPAGAGSALNAVTRTITGVGAGLRVDYSWLNGDLTSIDAITSGGTGYEVGDIVYVGYVETGIITITAVTTGGGVTGFTLADPGSNYVVGNVLTGSIPGGAGWSITVSGVANIPAVGGGQSLWAQVPQRFNQQQVLPTNSGPAVNNPAAIQYSFMYPKRDSLIEPPIGDLS
jgi:hypothetical protein